MRRFLKLVGRFLGGLVAVLVIGTALVYAETTRRLNKVYSFNEPALAIPSDSVAVAKGQHFVQAIGKCAGCHGDDLAGKIAADNFLIGRLYSANLSVHTIHDR